LQQLKKGDLTVRHILLLSITFILTCASVEAQGPVQNPANHHWYQAVDPIPGGWPAAKAQAESMTFHGMNGHLATITSGDESNFISANLSAACTGGYWLGGFQDRSAPDYSEPAGGWRWVTGEPWNFTFWSAGEPNNQFGIEDYLLFRGFADCTWNDGRTNDFAPRGFLVEFDPPCQVDACGPGITDSCVSLTIGAKPGWPPQTSMDAVFIPPSGMTVANYAQACGFTELNWQQIVEFVPPPSPFQEVGLPPGFTPIPLRAGFGVTFFDPPPRGYFVPNEPSWAYPFYYDATELALNPIVCASDQVEGALNVPANALCFHDAPADPCLQGGNKDLQVTYCGGQAAQTGAALLFKTALVGVSQTFSSGTVLQDWEWLDNFNGTADGFIVTLKNPGPVDPGSGRGGITITSINGVLQTPPTVSCTAIPNTLWPPNGKEVSVDISGTVTAGTQALVLESVAFAVSDTEAQIQPSGAVAVGSDGTYSFTVPLFAARDGNNQNGRQYTITVNAGDQIGNVGSCSTVVTVPHDQGQ
jgi:hypothetical protein